MSLTFPTLITEANVLGGIADSVALIRAPQADNAEVVETISFDTGRFRPPPRVVYNPEPDRQIKFRSGRLDYRFKWRAEFTFELPFLTAAEAVKWTKCYNYYLAGYDVFMRPHNDNALTLEWQVCPTPGSPYELGFFADMYLGHKATFNWTSIHTQSDLNTKSSQVRLRPVHT